MKKRWMEKEIVFLKDNYGVLGPHKCTDMLGRSLYSTKQKAVRLGFGKTRRPFTTQEIEYIIKNYAQKGPISLAVEMGLNRDSIYEVAQRLGLKMDSKARGEISTITNTGRYVSPITRKKIGNANRRYFETNHCVACGTKIKRQSTKCQTCELKSRSGEGHNWWNGGVTSLYEVIFSRLYPIWKFPILARDNFTCQECGMAKCHLEVHHIRFFTTIKDKVMQANPRLSPINDKYELAELIVKEHKIEDGITLCRSCHEKIHRKKEGELLESLNATGEDNQQPSRSNVIDMVGRKVQRVMGEDSQPIIPTRAPSTLFAKV